MRQMNNESDSVVDATRNSAGAAKKPRNRFDRLEWAGAFGDLGTLIPFMAVYIVVVNTPASKRCAL